jgi:hypothetical protein
MSELIVLVVAVTLLSGYVLLHIYIKMSCAKQHVLTMSVDGGINEATQLSSYRMIDYIYIRTVQKRDGIIEILLRTHIQVL